MHLDARTYSIRYVRDGLLALGPGINVSYISPEGWMLPRLEERNGVKWAPNDRPDENDEFLFEERESKRAERSRTRARKKRRKERS